MADSEVTPGTSTPSASSLAKKEKKATNPRAKPTHPPTAEMVTNAIKGLKERGGSSLQAIKKYIAGNYKVDAEKVAPFIKKYLKSAVVSGALVQTKGKGASGSFKLPTSGSSASKQSSGEKKSANAKTASPVKKASADKQKVEKKAPKKKSAAETNLAKKTVAAKKSAKSSGTSATKAKSPKAKANKAGPTKKPKAPKPKTAKSPAKPKKAASPKKK